jgi:hypothetical protein
MLPLEGNGNATGNVRELPPHFGQGLTRQGGVFTRLHDRQLPLNERHAVMQQCRSSAWPR